jgi:glycosyltransferase involved in cell wall biosynthesis/ubiquinone/menaquinone biosynthesis C-methylase UbiE
LKKKFRIFAVADAAFAATGYGNQSEVILSRLVKRGWDIYQLPCNAYSMHRCEPGEEYPLYKGIKMIPNKEFERVGMDGLYGTKESIWDIYTKIRPDVVWTVNDFYRIAGLTEFSSEFMDRFVYWQPIDNPYMPDNWCGVKGQFLNNMRFVIYMSKFGWDVNAKYLPYVMYKDAVYLAVSSDVFKPLYSKEEMKKVTGFENKFVILTVGRHQPRKMIWKTANSVTKFLKTHPDAVWYCKTDPVDAAMADFPKEEKDLIYIAEREGVKDRVFYEPRFFSAEQMNEFYNTGDVFIHLSGGEGFGIPYVESMMAGTPCILADNTTSPELTGNWEFGLPVKIKSQITLKQFNSMYDIADEDDGVRQLEFAYNDWKNGSKWLKEAGKKAREFHKEWCEVEKVVDRWEEYFYRMIRYNNKIVWNSPMGAGVGFSITSETIIPKLEELGYDIYLADVNTVDSPVLDNHFKELKKKYIDAKSHIDFDKHINADFYLQETFDTMKGNKKIGWAFAESTKLRRSYVNQCNTLNTVITTSEFTKKAMQDSGVTTDIRIVNPWVDTEAYPLLDRSTPRDKFTFLHVGVAMIRKNVPQLLEAYTKAFPEPETSNVRLVVKSNDYGVLTPFQEQYKDRKDITWIYTDIQKPLSHEEMLMLYKGADCYVNASHGEGIGNPEMEAMSTGLPVISSNWDGRSVFLDDEVGWMLKVNRMEKAYDMGDPNEDSGVWACYDEEDMIRILREAAGNPQLCKEKGKKAAERVREKFTPDKAALMFDEIFMDYYTPPHLSNDIKSPAKAKVEPVYDENYFTNIHKYNSEWQEDWANTLIKETDGMKGNILDIGCGTGFLMKHLLAHGKNIVGIDMSDWAVAHPMPGCEGRIFKGNAMDIPYDDRTFDLAIAFSLLEHLPEEDVPRVLREIKRVSKRAVLLIAMAEQEWQKSELESGDPTHINIKPPYWWITKFQEAGLKIVKTDNKFAYLVEPAGG